MVYLNASDGEYEKGLRKKIIIAKNVFYKYPDGTEAVRDFSIEIFDGQKVAILGPNGCGKSTLILLLSGLLKPTKGEILIFGKEVNRENSEFFRRNIGVVFQNPDDFLFNPTVKEELLYTPAQLGIDYDSAIKLAKEFAKKFEIENLFEKPPFRLSGGEKKKVSIACSLMLNPKILFLDEPTANVDGKTRRKILELIQASKGTIITATHEIDIVPKIAERVVVIGDNKDIIADGDLDLLEKESVLVSAGVL